MRNLGFSLLELMMVIAIIGIIAAMAVPAYERYSISAKMVDVINYTSEYKQSINMYYTMNRKLPLKNGDIISGGPIDLKVGSDNEDDLPKIFSNIKAIKEGKGLVVLFTVSEDVLVDLPDENRTVAMGVKVAKNGKSLTFACGAFDDDIRLENMTVLPNSCREEEVSDWLRE